MKFIYVSRHFNKSGFYILKKLLEEGTYIPEAVLLPLTNSHNQLDDESALERDISVYQKEVEHFNSPSLKFFKSIKLLSEKYNVPVIYLKCIKTDEAYQTLSKYEPDLIVLGGGWPQLIPERVIDLPKAGVINTHPSLLPKFRGTDIHRWQVLNNVSKSGTTIHYIDKTFDTGEILGQQSVEVEMEDTPQTVFEKTAKVAGPLMIDVLKKIETNLPNKVVGKVQEARTDRSRYFSRWRWEDHDFLKINWSKKAIDIYKLILASTQESYKYNGPYFIYNNKKVIIRSARITPIKSKAQVGTILSIDDKGAVVKCGDDNEAIQLNLVQIGSINGFPEEENTEPAKMAKELFQELNIEEQFSVNF